MSPSLVLEINPVNQQPAPIHPPNQMSWLGRQLEVLKASNLKYYLPIGCATVTGLITFLGVPLAIALTGCRLAVSENKEHAALGKKMQAGAGYALATEALLIGGIALALTIRSCFNQAEEENDD